MKIKYVLGLLLTITNLKASDNSHETQEGFSYQQRPQHIQQEVDTAFDKLKHFNGPGWVLNGNNINYICNFAFDRYLYDHLSKADKGTEINYLDVGAGNFGSGRTLIKNLLNKNNGVVEYMKENNIKLRVVGLNGENNDVGKVKHADGVVEEYSFGAVKVENLIEELNRLEVGFEYDIVSSSYCLLHLVDPLGTFDQIMKSLKKGGLFLYNGFLAGINNQTKDDFCGDAVHTNMTHVAMEAGPFLQQLADRCSYLPQLIVKKVESYNLPYSYQGSLFNIPSGEFWQVHSRIICKYFYTPKEAKEFILQKSQYPDVLSRYGSTSFFGDEYLFSSLKGYFKHMNHVFDYKGRKSD